MACKRKPKRSRRQTVATRRYADLMKKRRSRYKRRRELIAEVKRRRRIVRYYLRQRQDLSESESARSTAEKFGRSLASVRRYASAYNTGGIQALKPSQPGAKTATTQIPIAVKMLVVTIRALLGWCGQRIAAEFERRDIYELSHTSVYHIFRRYHIKTRTYHPKAVTNGIDYSRFQRDCPDDLWHVDFKGPFKLSSDTLYLFVIQDDYSRYALDVHVCQDCTADTAITRIQHAFQQYGVPRQLMSDNGRAFTSVWEDVIHRFEQTLRNWGYSSLDSRYRCQRFNKNCLK